MDNSQNRVSIFLNVRDPRGYRPEWGFEGGIFPHGDGGQISPETTAGIRAGNPPPFHFSLHSPQTIPPLLLVSTLLDGSTLLPLAFSPASLCSSRRYTLLGPACLVTGETAAFLQHRSPSASLAFLRAVCPPNLCATRPLSTHQSSTKLAGSDLTPSASRYSPTRRCSPLPVPPLLAAALSDC
ncbi:hypothetical protein PIB30_044341 [Stylosanthes scabra]|uniref:Uncharacterized protein n=1 Tax=Stylosanthes scabra TaxID=79078 RepID=A0ABU6QF72_9FABA|nr:hypothetical protein [Stylosanthes scabra]